jgi:hypothetical protein
MWRGGSAKPSAAPLARLGDRLVRQADDGEGRQPRGDRHLGLDIDDLDPVECHGANSRDHLPTRCFSP